MINSVISFNQLETDRSWNLPQLLDIREVCSRIAAEVQAVWGSGLKLNISIATDCGSAMLDETAFRRVLENLLTNAFRYTPLDGIVSLIVQRENSRLCLEISDSGIGIPEDDLALIFDAFYRSRNVEGRRGLGLGLSIVHESLSQMGGIITVNSRVGEGTTMRVEIPID
jgi:signal transduction histidine kinase